MTELLRQQLVTRGPRFREITLPNDIESTPCSDCEQQIGPGDVLWFDTHTQRGVCDDCGLETLWKNAGVHDEDWLDLPF